MKELWTPGEGPSLADLQRVVEACTRFEDQWLAGRRPHIEDFLAQTPEPLRPDLLRDLLRLDLHYRRKGGERPAPEEYRRRLPEYAAVIDATFAAAPGTPAPANGTAPDSPPMPLTESPSSATAGADGPALTAAPGYEVLGELGRGAMGVVYKARQKGLKRLVALKMVLAGAHAGPAELARFRREAEAVARLRHPNIVQIYEVGEHDGLPFFSLEYVERGTLAEQVAGKPLPPRRAAETVEALARAAHSAHQVGVVHRDLKPANVLVAADGTPKVTDFGLAKLLDAEERPLTRTGAILGTPAYMAPEQVSREVHAVGPWSDVYALGAILYELLTGRAPFGGGVETVLLDVLEREPYPPRRLNAAAPRDLETVCLKCLRKEPSRRYRSAADLADDLRRYLNGQPVKARPAGVTERGWRWCRQNPVLAGLTGLVAALLVLITAISVLASVQLRDHLEHARNAEQAERDAKLAEREAKEEALERLRGSYLALARAGRFSRQPGQQFDSLEALAKAARIRPSLELRNEAVACMAVPDLRRGRSWEGYPRGSTGLVFDEKLERYARSDGAGNISVRRVADDKELVRLPGQGQTAAFLRFSPDGRFLCARSDGFTCRVWDVGRRRLVEIPSGAFDFTPDSRGAALSLPDHSIALYDLGSGRVVKRLPKPGATHHYYLAVSPDGRQLAVSCFDPRVAVQVLDVDTGKVAVTLPHPGPVRALAWRPDGGLLATGCDDSCIHLWDPKTARRVAVLEGHEAVPIEVAFNRRGNLLASTSWDGTVRLWDPVAKRQLVSAPGGYHGGFPKYQFSPDDRRLAFAWDGGSTMAWAGAPTIALWEVDAAPACQTLTSHRALGRRGGAGISPDGRVLAWAHDDGVRLWDLAFGREVAHLDQFGGAGTALFTPDRQSLIVYSGHGIHSCPLKATREADNTLSLRIGPPRRLLRALPTEAGFHAASLSRDGNSLAVVNRAQGQVIVVDLTGRTKAVLPGHPQIASLALSPDAKWVASIPFPNFGSPVVRVSSVQTTKVVWQLADDSVLAGFSPDGRWLVTCRDQCCLRAVGTWRVVKTIPAEPALGRPTSAAFSKDGKVLAIGYPSARVVRLVDPDTGKEFVTLSALVRLRVGGLTFSPDGSRLAVGCGKGIIQVWDLRLIRARLAGMGLDWDAPPLPPAREPAGGRLLAVTVIPDNVAEFRKEVELNPRDARAHLRLAGALRGKGQVDEAISHFRKATELNPKDARAHHSLANALLAAGRLDEAIESYRRALDLDPRDADAHTNLGSALHARGRLDDAVRCYRKAIELGPKLAMARYNLGNAMLAKGELDEAVRWYRESTNLDPRYAEAYCNLGVVLARQGRFADAVRALERGHELGSARPRWPYPSGEWLVRIKHLEELDGKLPALIRGKVQPRDAAERLEVAGMCRQPSRRLYASAARFYAEAFAGQPKFADDLNAGHRYRAACAAARAGCGQGKDAGTLGDGERARLRRQALDWLRADLAAWTKSAEKGDPATLARVRQRLKQREEAPEFAGVRDEGALDKLPESERAAWRQLWASARDARRALEHYLRGQGLLREARFVEARAATRRALDLLPERDPLRDVASRQLRRCEELIARDKQVRTTRRFSGHTGEVTCVAISRDGRHGLSGGFDKTVRLWDLRTAKPLLRLEGHTKPVWCVALAPGGGLGASSGQDALVLLWDLKAGKLRHRLAGHGDTVSAVAFSADGRRLYSCSWDHTVRVWDVAEGKELRRFDLGAPVLSLAFAPDGCHALFGSTDGLLRLWDLRAEKEVRRFATFKSSVEGLAFAPDGLRAVASCFAEGTIRLYDVERGEEVGRFEGHAGRLDSVVFLPSGKRLLSAGMDGTLRLWDVASRRERHRLVAHTPLRGLALSPDGRQAVAGCFDPLVSILGLWELPD